MNHGYKRIVLASIFSTDQLKDHLSHTSFNPSQSAIIDNAANCHIWNSKRSFIGDIRPISMNEGVVTIGGSDHFPTGVGNVKASWTDDNGVTFNKTLKNVLYFPSSPVNIISCHALAGEFLDSNGAPDEEGTFICSKRSYSIFQWDHCKFKKTLLHPLSGLPEIEIITYDKKIDSMMTYFSRFDPRKIFSFSSLLND